MNDVAGWSLAERRPVPDLNAAQWQCVVPIGDVAPWMSDVLQRVNAFEDLRPGWNGTRSPAVLREALVLARQLVVAAAQVEDLRAPNVGPVPGGGLQLEWRMGKKELELEILPTGDLGVLRVDGDTVF